jgi:hypothetical protein
MSRGLIDPNKEPTVEPTDKRTHPHASYAFNYCHAKIVASDGQSVALQVVDLTSAGCAKVFHETASGAKSDRAELAKVLVLAPAMLAQSAV